MHIWRNEACRGMAEIRLKRKVDVRKLTVRVAETYLAFFRSFSPLRSRTSTAVVEHASAVHRHVRRTFSSCRTREFAARRGSIWAQQYQFGQFFRGRTFSTNLIARFFSPLIKQKFDKFTKKKNAQTISSHNIPGIIISISSNN